MAAWYLSSGAVALSDSQARGLVPAGSLYELSFATLEGDPVGTIRDIYDRLGWTMSPDTLALLQQHCAGLQGFRKNVFSTLDAASKALVARRWGPSFREFGYTI